MGASNSSSVVVSKPTAPAVSGFHVKISFDGQDIVNNEGGTLEDHIKQAYDQGKAEGVTAIRASLDNVAAQVYGNMKEQLAGIEKQSEGRSEEIVAGLRSKVSAPLRLTACDTEASLLTSCWKENSDAHFVCRNLVNSYTACSAGLQT